MVRKIVDKRNYIILAIIIILIVFIVINLNSKVNEQIKSFNYFNEDITIKIYSNKNMDSTFKEIDGIYKKYQKYYQNPSQNTGKDLIKLLEYGKNAYEETGGLIDITAGELITSIEDDKTYNFHTTINSLDFNKKETLKNISIDSLIGAYATNIVKEYLDENKIKKYIINEDGNIIAGDHYNDDKYKVSITDTNGNLVKIVYLNGESMATKGNTSKFKPYMVNPLTSSKNKENNLISVISKDINEANKVANALYLMSIDDGKEFAKKYDVEVLWHTNDEKTYTTDGFKRYTKNSWQSIYSVKILCKEKVIYKRFKKSLKTTFSCDKLYIVSQKGSINLEWLLWIFYLKLLIKTLSLSV